MPSPSLPPGATPTPWVAEGVNIYAKAPATVRPWVAKTIYGDCRDAAFIVQAVNSHAALVGALQELVTAMYRYQADVDDEAPVAHRQMMHRAEQALTLAASAVNPEDGHE